MTLQIRYFISFEQCLFTWLILCTETFMPLNENTESKHLDFLEEASLPPKFASLSAIVLIRYTQPVVFGCWGF